MSHGWDYKSGDWLVICDVCSVKVNASKTRKRWDGFKVCFDCFENRHPQDFIKSRNDKISVPFTRPQPPDVFVEVDSYEYNVAIPNWAYPGYVIPNNTFGFIPGEDPPIY